MLVQRKLNLDKDNIEWLENTHPGVSLSAFFNLCLEKFRLGMGENTPEHYMSIAITRMMEEQE
jgi:hypothetical protein